jgi:hypothetical protein
MTVLRPLKLVLTNYPEGQVEFLEAVNNPEDAVDHSLGFGSTGDSDRGSTV